MLICNLSRLIDEIKQHFGAALTSDSLEPPLQPPKFNVECGTVRFQCLTWSWHPCKLSNIEVGGDGGSQENGGKKKLLNSVVQQYCDDCYDYYYYYH